MRPAFGVASPLISHRLVIESGITVIAGIFWILGAGADKIMNALPRK
jgi:hypothetical protein